MPLATRQDYVDLVENVYFGCMSRGQLEPILALFHADAMITTFYGETPARRMRFDPGPGEEPLPLFFSKAIDTFNVGYSDFVHFVDVEQQRTAAIYTLTIAPKTEATGASSRSLRNCNFFQFSNGQLRAVTAYFANPATIPAP